MLSVKDRKIIAEVGDTDEPIFILRAKDILSLFPLKEYERMVEMFGPDEHEMQMRVATRIAEFREWQRNNVSRVKYPD